MRQMVEKKIKPYRLITVMHHKIRSPSIQVRSKAKKLGNRGFYAIFSNMTQQGEQLTGIYEDMNS